MAFLMTKFLDASIFHHHLNFRPSHTSNNTQICAHKTLVPYVMMIMMMKMSLVSGDGDANSNDNNDGDDIMMKRMTVLDL